MNARDWKLDELVRLRLRSEALPERVRVAGQDLETARFLEGFRHDRREAWPSIAAFAQHTERPFVCEVALSL